MSMAGLSISRLERMHEVLSGYVERKVMPGLVALVSHHDDVYVATLGTMSVGYPAPMKRGLDESIEGWLPELANRRVLKSVSSPPDDTVPALRRLSPQRTCRGIESIQ